MLQVTPSAKLGKPSPVDNLWKTGADADPSPPHNLEAEQALLGAILINNQAAERVPDLTPDHFYDDLHREMFAVMSEAFAAGRTFTATTLAERFRAVRITDDLNGAQYLGRLMAEATTTRNVREYARTIIDLSQRRALMVVGADLADAASDPSNPKSPAEMIEDAERKLFHASIVGKNGHEVEFSAAVTKALDAANQARMDGGQIRGVKTGFSDLDKRLGGLGNGNLIILAGRPSMGKTALATNIVSHVAQTGDHVHFFSLEMTSEELAMRQIGEVSGIASDKLRRGDFSDEQFRDIHRAAQRLSGLPVTVDETGGITIAALAAKARRVKRRKKTALIVIDYLQIMGMAGKSGNRVTDITETTVALKALAKELDVPIVVLSQLNRELEKRNDKRPQLSDLRESGSIEQDADVVMFVYREEYYVERTKPDAADMMAMMDWEGRMRNAAGKAEVIISKQRHGSVGIVEMAFDGALTRFSDLAHEQAP